MSPLHSSEFDKPHDLYRLYDEDGALLYVGVTSQGMARLLAHSNGAEWWPQVSIATFTHYTDRHTAFQMEQVAIEDEDPVYNVRRPGWPNGEAAQLLAQARRLLHEERKSSADVA